MYFPVADLEVNPLIPPAVALAISFFTSMAGVSGAFLLLPFHVSVLGYHTPSASGTNQLYNVVAIPSGVYRYVREGRMVWPLTWAVVAGTLPGVLIGALVRVRYLPDPRDFKLFAGLVLLTIAARLLRDVLGKRGGGGRSADAQFVQGVRERGEKDGHGRQLPRAVVRKAGPSRIVYEFNGQEFGVSAAAVGIISLGVGVIGGIYGIGGGAIMAPILVSVFGLPVYTVAGAALMGTFVTSVAGVLFYQLIAPFHPDVAVAPDWALGVLFGVGGMAGMYCGARLQKFVPARVIKWLLAGCVLFTAGQYIIGFFR